MVFALYRVKDQEINNDIALSAFFRNIENEEMMLIEPIIG